jgi:hypothetical protein
VLFPVVATLLIALIFYIAVPVAGAFSARGNWRRFRKRILELSFFPILHYRDLPRDAGTRPGESVEVGTFRLFGRVEALEGTNRIWIRGKSVSAMVDCSGSPIYVLAEEGTGAGAIERIPWKSVSSLGEGTKLFVGGRLIVEGGRPVFVDEPERPLIVVSYDGDEAGLLASLIASGRPLNEYWNPATRISLAVGMTISSGLLVFFANRELFPTVRVLTFIAAMIPVLPLAPPGIGFFLLYRYLWRSALFLRTERDLVALPTRYFEEGGPESFALPGGGRYTRRSLPRGHPPPAGAELREIKSLRDRESGTWVVFEPEGTDDPAAEFVAISGEPIRLASMADRKSFALVLAAAAACGTSIVVNFVLAFLIWRGGL